MTEETKTQTTSPEVKEVKEEKKDTKIPTKFKGIVDSVDKLTVVELNELVKVFEEKFGVSAAALQMSGGGGSGGDDADEAGGTVSVELTAAGDAKIQVIKAIKELFGLGLKEAKDLVDAAPSMLKEGVDKKEADEIKGKIEAAGGAVSIK